LKARPSPRVRIESTIKQQVVQRRKYVLGATLSYIAVSALLGAVIATVALAVSSMPEKGIDRTRQKVLRAIVQYLFVVNFATLAVLILTTVMLALTGHLTIRPMIVWTLASLFLSVIFLGRLRLLLPSAKEAPKLIQKEGP